MFAQASSSPHRPLLGGWRARPRRRQSLRTSHRQDSCRHRRRRRVPASRPSTVPPDRTAKRTSGSPRSPYQRPRRRACVDTPSRPGSQLEDHTLCSTPSPGPNAACWRPPQSGLHRPPILHRRPARPPCTPQRHARTRGGKYRSRGSAHAERARTSNDPGFCPQCSSRRTSGRPGSPAPRGTAPAPSGSQTRSRQ